MTGAMYAAIAGLKAHMNKLNVIGNNVANVNTYGYKSGRTVFQDSMYTISQTGSNGTEYVGGRNPSQIGYGASIRSIDLNMGTSNYAPTGYPLDCMIDGDGFFLVSERKDAGIDLTNAESLKGFDLTRLGTFGFDAEGYMVDGYGRIVYGFACIGHTIDAETGEELPAYSKILTALRLPMADTDGKGVLPAESETGTTVEDVTVGSDGTTTLTTRAQYNSMTIDGATGKITGINKNTDQVETIGCIALGMVDNPAGVTHQVGPYYKALDGAGSVRIASVGGLVEGYLNTKADDVSEDGLVNPGDDPTDVNQIYRINKSGKTKLQSNGLELSGTDLATEISEMITTQRGYQANTRIITVTDSMLEELVNMKR